nr:MAG TPA: hypothetical protein [Caudoviricetes sp.]
MIFYNKTTVVYSHFALHRRLLGYFLRFNMFLLENLLVL